MLLTTNTPAHPTLVAAATMFAETAALANWPVDIEVCAVRSTGRLTTSIVTHGRDQQMAEALCAWAAICTNAGVVATLDVE